MKKKIRIRVDPVGVESDHPEGFRVYRERADMDVFTPIAGFYGHDAKVFLDAFMASLYAGLHLAFVVNGLEFQIEGWNPK